VVNVTAFCTRHLNPERRLHCSVKELHHEEDPFENVFDLL
jgi:hypothetical protein